MLEDEDEWKFDYNGYFCEMNDGCGAQVPMEYIRLRDNLAGTSDADLLDASRALHYGLLLCDGCLAMWKAEYAARR